MPKRLRWCSRALLKRWKADPIVTSKPFSIGVKPTTVDVARVAGVSLATVDRVLNERPGVRAITIEKVRDAIDKLGFTRDTAAANLARQRVYKLVFILPETTNEFVTALENEIYELRTKAIHERTTVECLHVPPFEPSAIVAAFDALDADRVDGVAVFGPETPAVRDAVRRARARGISVVALVADLPSSKRDYFVGIDNVAAGRTAAQLMGRFTRGAGRILVITGSRLARDHLERRKGFDSVMAAEFPQLDVVASIEGRDDPALIRKLLPKTFKTYPDICGVYSSAAGNQGLIQFLKNSGRAQDLVIVAHELTESSRTALEDGAFDAIISQDSGHLIRSATRVLKATADRLPIDHTQERIRLDIYIRENLPAPAPFIQEETQ